MADKDFKVKTGLDLPAPLPVTEGGTGQTSVENTRNAIMPTQSGHSGKFITTDGTNMTWAVAPQQTATDGAVGYKVFAGNTTPTGQNVGDIWIDQTTGNGIQLVRWRKTIASAASTLSGLDDNNLTLTYTAGNEQVYINGTLITRGQDYTATNGTSISLTQAVEVGDTVEIFGNPLFSVTDTYTQAQAQSVFTPNTNTFYAGKNKIINGDFGIWQRGTSFTLSTGVSTYTADRFFLVMPGGTVVTRETFAPGEAPVAGYEGKYYIRTVINTNAQNYESGFRVEDVRTLAGQTATLSFWARSTVGAAPLGYAIFQNFGTGGSPSGMVQATQLTGSGPYTPTSGWQRYSYTFSIPSIAGKTIGTNNDSYLLVRPFQFATTATNTSVDLWGVQLEAGPVATAFTTATGNPQSELAACQRYYYRVNSSLDSYVTFGLGWVDTSTQAYYTIPMPVTLRGNPNIAFSAANTFLAGIPGGSLTGTATATNTLGSQLPVVRLTVASGLTPGNATRLLANGTSNAYIEFSAEL